jgi:hypothetical protein
VTRWLGFVELATLGALLLAAAVSLASAALWPLLRRGLGRRHPASTARWLWLAAVSPSLAPPLLIALSLLPALLGVDHCLAHREHVHLCLAHLAGVQSPALVALALVIATGLGVAFVAGAWNLARAGRALARLVPTARSDLAPDVALLATPRPLSLCLGAWRPRIVVSEGLVRALAPTSLAVVLAHERAHARRRDALRTFAARALSWPHLPRVRRELLAALALASERACDEAAAESSGDRLLVAETILAVERLARGEAPALAASFAGGVVPARVEGLLADAAPPVPARRAWLHGAAWAATAIPLLEPLHHGLEHLLGRLLSLL